MKKGLLFTTTLSFAVFSAFVTASPTQAALTASAKTLTPQAIIQVITPASTTTTTNSTTITTGSATSTTTGTTTGTKSDTGFAIIVSTQDLNEVYTTLLTAYTRSNIAITRLATKDIKMTNATASLIKTATSLANAKTFLDSKVKTKLTTEKAITELTLARTNLLTALSEAKTAISLSTAANTATNSTQTTSPAFQTTKDAE